MLFCRALSQRHLLSPHLPGFSQWLQLGAIGSMFPLCCTEDQWSLQLLSFAAASATCPPERAIEWQRLPPPLRKQVSTGSGCPFNSSLTCLLWAAGAAAPACSNAARKRCACPAYHGAQTSLGGMCFTFLPGVATTIASQGHLVKVSASGSPALAFQNTIDALYCCNVTGRTHEDVPPDACQSEELSVRFPAWRAVISVALFSWKWVSLH